jgi:hypothetical protein
VVASQTWGGGATGSAGGDVAISEGAAGKATGSPRRCCSEPRGGRRGRR